MVIFLRETGERLMLSNTTIHIAVAYTDYLLSKQEIFSNQKYYLIALISLMLAAKYDELDKNIPPIQDYIRAANSKIDNLTVEEIKDCEVLCLKILDWNLKIVTPLVL